MLSPASLDQTTFNHQISFRHQAGPVTFDVQFSLCAPWTAIFAPSGAGKTTILRIIAGLEKPSFGRIDLNDHRSYIVLDTERGIFVPPYQRGLRFVAQRPALFPHLSVIQNIRYGMHWQLRQDDKLNGGCDINRIMDICRIPLHLREEKPSNLSGGERQRVALARAIATGGGRLLMLDEPFTGLEAEMRDGLIHDLRRWAIDHHTPVLLVTHDIGEVFAAQAHVLKMESGRIIASGPASEVLANERERLIKRLQQ